MNKLSNYNKRTIGKQYEEAAIKYLESKGYEIIATNFNCHIGEIDIIAKDGGYLSFIEVKYRSNTKKGYPYESITPYKIKKIINSAKFFMLSNHISFETPCRFDVVAFLADEIKLYKNAFEE